MVMNERDRFIIEQYENDEEMMILIFAQWCVNNNFNAVELYKKAYPEQLQNPALLSALEKTMPKEQSDEISLEVVQQVLQLFGNDDLAFIIDQEVKKKKN